MSQCPGFDKGFGLPQRQANALCVTRSYFGKDGFGLGLYAAGTGFLFSSKGRFSYIATAAHNLFEPILGRKAVWIDCYFGRQGDTAKASRRVIAASVPREFADSAGAPGHDYGVGRIDLLGADRFDPIPLLLSTAAGDTRKRMPGYPNEGDCKGTFLPWYGDFTVFPCSDRNYAYRDQPSYEGQSGAPLVSQPSPSDPISAFGLHVRGPAAADAPRAVRFSQPVFDEMWGWT